MFASSQEFDAVVLGAGVVGINSAYWLARAGKTVCVIDRQPAAALETSFANGGQISASHAEPWANPSAPAKIFQWLFRSDAPLLFRPRLDPHQWLWIARFLIDCMPHRADRHTAEIVQLAIESRALLKEIRSRENISYDERSCGILHFYRDHREFEAAIPVADLMRKYGCNRRVIEAEEVVRIEPAFEASRACIVGATYTEEDESGDAMKYTQALAQVCAGMGVKFLYGSEIVSLDVGRKSQILAIQARTPKGYASISGRDVVVSLGTYSSPFLRAYGIALCIYPAKGYSVTIPIEGHAGSPVTSLTDDENKLVFSNFGSRLRVAGTAELSGYSIQLNLKRCQSIVDKVRDLFPDAGNFGRTSFWTGLRPATPSNIPYLGRTRSYRNLWLNTGHGMLGWTMGAGSGKRIADMIDAQDGPAVA